MFWDEMFTERFYAFALKIQNDCTEKNNVTSETQKNVHMVHHPLSFLPSFFHSFLPSFLLFLPSSIPSFFHLSISSFFILSSLPSFLLSFLPSFILSFLLSFIHSFLLSPSTHHRKCNWSGNSCDESKQASKVSKTWKCTYGEEIDR